MWVSADVNGDGDIDDPEDVLAGLVRRRKAEAAQYLTPDPATVAETAPLPMSQAVQAEKPAIKSTTVIAGGLLAAAGAASVADQINQVAPIITSITTVGSFGQGMLKLGGLALSVTALAAVAFMLYRYIPKRRHGEVLTWALCCPTSGRRCSLRRR